MAENRRLSFHFTIRLSVKKEKDLYKERSDDVQHTVEKSFYTIHNTIYPPEILIAALL